MKKEGKEQRGKTQRSKKLLVAGIAVIFAAAALPGCAKRATPENLLRDMARNMAAAESMVYKVAVTAEMSSGGNGIGVDMDLDVETVKDSEKVHMTGRLGMNMMGMDFGTDLELYTVPADEGYTTYTRAGEIWVKSAADAADGRLEAGMFENMQAQAALFELSEELTDVNGQECYELAGDMGGETLADILNDDMLSALSGLSIDEETIAGSALPCTLDIYRENILPARLWIDLRDLAGNMTGAVAEAGGGDMDVSEYSMEITFLEYDSVGEIEVPEEALSAPEAGSDDLLYAIPDGGDAETSAQPDGETDGQGDADTGVSGPAEQSGELGTHWDSYTVQINDRVLTLPCTMADMEAAGLSIDASFVTPDTMIDDYYIAWLQDENGNRIMVDILPAGSEAQPVSGCLVVGIAVSSYDTMEGGIDIVFPGGIRTGSMAEDVLAAYGETDDVYEGEVIDIYSWYAEDSYYNGCSVDIDAESQVVTEIRLSRYE